MSSEKFSEQHKLNLKRDDKTGVYSTVGKAPYNQHACIQFKYPKDVPFVYIELKITKSNDTYPVIGIGLATADPTKWASYPRGMVGWSGSNVGYSVDSGAIYNCSKTARPYLVKCSVGDVIGMFWGLKSGDLFFTKNGKKLNFLGNRSPLQNKNMLPTITCKDSRNNEFTLNFDGKTTKFMFDLKSIEEKTESDKPLKELVVDNSQFLGDDLQKAYGLKDYTDMSFTLGNGEDIPAHKIIVALRSPVLGDLIKKSSDGKVVIDSKFSASTFKLLIQYIYTGKCKLNESNWNDVLKCSDYFKVASLRKHCFEFLIKNLTKDTVLDMLTKAQNGEYEFDATDLIKRLVVFMEKKAYKIIKTQGFLKLSEQSIILMLKNTNTCVDEMEMIRAIMKWAEHNSKNTGKDKKELLKNIARHIRYPLLSPQELVKEVKPLGIIPNDLYVQAVEFNAFPEKFSKIKLTNPLFKKRYRTFSGTSIVDEKMARQLGLWLPSSKKGWELIYKGSKHGFTTSAFHRQCDNQGPTVTVIKSNNGNVFGGYNPQTWMSSGSYTYNNKSFVFSLVNSLKAPIKMCNNTNNTHSCYNSSSYGPTFGGGHDLYLCNNCNTTRSSYSNLGYSFRLPGYNYNTNQIKSFLAGSYYFTVKEVEVFKMRKD